ncbi:hypothetical protein NQZ68_006062, partial [Dissostichus eleginoides]
MSFERSTFIGNLEELSLSGLPLVVGGGGGEANSESTNEQVDVWLWLQLHLLFDEETGPHNVLLRSFLQPYFRTAAPTGHRLRTSTKAVALSVKCQLGIAPRKNSHPLVHISSFTRDSLSNAKAFSSSDSLAKVQEVASWLLEMNQDLLSGGSSSRRGRGPGGPAVRGNASSTTRAPQQAAEEGDEDEHMNRVVEEEEQLQQR